MKIRIETNQYDLESVSDNQTSLISELSKEISSDITHFGFDNISVDVEYTDIYENEEGFHSTGELRYVIESDEDTLKRYFEELQNMTYDNAEVRFNYEDKTIESKDDCNTEWTDISDTVFNDYTTYSII